MMILNFNVTPDEVAEGTGVPVNRVEMKFLDMNGGDYVLTVEPRKENGNTHLDINLKYPEGEDQSLESIWIEAQE